MSEIDWQAELLDPIYAELGVEAALKSAPGEPIATITALDLTAGIVLDLGGISMGAITPAAAVRVAELAEHGIDAAALKDGTITLNGATWKIKAPHPKPSPAGEAAGEVYLLLEEVDCG
jgi:hypothetical protein